MITLYPPFKADDMKSLFKRVITGNYQKIPIQYSVDLNKLIKSLLNVSPQKRPTCK